MAVLVLTGCIGTETPEERLRTNNECDVAGDRFWVDYQQRSSTFTNLVAQDRNSIFFHRNHFNRQLGECLVKIDLYEYNDDEEEIYLASDTKLFAAHSGITASDGPGFWTITKNGKDIEVTPANDLSAAEMLKREAALQWFNSLMKK
jgi:hypothetical protein